MPRLFTFCVPVRPSGGVLVRPVRNLLRAATRHDGHVADLVQDAGPLHGIEFREIRDHLRDELVGLQLADLVFECAAASVEEVGNTDVQGLGETRERRERGTGFLVLDLGDVGAGHAHALRELPLAQSGTETQRTNCVRYG